MTSSNFLWLDNLDADERRQFLTEILRWWDSDFAALADLSDLIHEWEESAIANASPDIAEAFEGLATYMPSEAKST